ncbi:MAG: hypothetical protein ACI978_002179, partial [Oleispira sp.]
GSYSFEQPLVVALGDECVEELLLMVSFLLFCRVAASFNKKINKDKKQLAFAPSSPILANNF